jgi:hypothetical protein
MAAVEDKPITAQDAAEPGEGTSDPVSPELRDAIAAANEPEPDDDDDDDPDDDEPDDVAALAAPVIDMEKLSDQLERENARHQKALAKIIAPVADDYDLCFLCLGQGAIVKAQAGHFEPEQHEAVLMQLDGPRKLRTHPEYRACETCDGWGKIDSQSKATGQQEQPCPTCQDKGWIREFAPPPVPTVAQLVPMPQFVPNFAPPAPPEPAVDKQVPPTGWVMGPNVNGNDSHGRWPGHTRYGMDPAQVGW